MSETNSPELEFKVSDVPVFKSLPIFAPGILEGRLPSKAYELVLNNCLDSKVRENNGSNLNINSVKDVAVYPLENTEDRLLEHYMGRMFDEWVNTFDVPLPPIPLASGITNAWVNYQKKGEFCPTHIHPDSIHFIVIVKVPYGDEEVDPSNYGKQFEGDMKDGSLEFVYNTPADGMSNLTIPLTSDDEGRVFLLPGRMMHQIYPFSNADGELITLCGNMSVFPIQQPQSEG